jgi:hypothetical protein
VSEVADVTRLDPCPFQRQPDASITPRDWSSTVVGTFAVVSRPSWTSATSVNVPPTSTPTSARVGRIEILRKPLPFVDDPGMSIPVHHSTEPLPGDRGLGLGRAQAERIAGTCDVYLRLFKHTAGLEPDDVTRLGGEALKRIGDYAPYLADEIEGIASGSGVSPEMICALNARTEVLRAGRGECSTIACLGTVTASGSPIGMQTWDWHDDLAQSWMRWTIDHASGHRVETMTEAGIVGRSVSRAPGWACC